jgi:hypothetical protein
MAVQLRSGDGIISVPHTHGSLARPAYTIWGGQFGTVLGDAAVALSDFSLAYEARFAPLIDSEVRIGPIEARVLITEGDDPVSLVHTTSFLGGKSSTDTQPPNEAVLIHKRTARGGLRGRGRVYMPWSLTGSDVNEVGVLTPALVTAWNAACVGFLSDVSNPLYVLHSPSESDVNEPSDPGPPSEITFMQVDPIVGTQRRRLGRR